MRSICVCVWGGGECTKELLNELKTQKPTGMDEQATSSRLLRQCRVTQGSEAGAELKRQSRVGGCAPKPIDPHKV